uniref:Miraculin-like n=1 Tax=Nicotiana tabacum TaxID=4097 RepID=A0A1S4C310_TOBAC|nr:PREDICTED: miraculin-like [Nicotiana tabacum]
MATCTTDTPNQALLRDVHDIDGNPLQVKARYFIFPVIGGGGVRLANLGDQDENACATAVVLSRSEVDKGKAVNFIPKDPKHEKIVEASSVNIQFYLDYYKCANLTVWKVDNYPTLPSRYTISTGATPGNPLELNSWFQIMSLGGSTYKIVFCPFGECQNVGIAEENGYNRLVLAENAKAFVFIKQGGYGKAEA